jgi:hypothetical protein
MLRSLWSDKRSELGVQSPSFGLKHAKPQRNYHLLEKGRAPLNKRANINTQLRLRLILVGLA